MEKSCISDSDGLWQQVFKKRGLQLEHVQVGCCGMAGMFGHQKRHQAMSRDIYESSWSKALETLPEGRVVATGFSCRHQVDILSEKVVRHPLEVLS